MQQPAQTATLITCDRTFKEGEVLDMLELVTKRMAAAVTRCSRDLGYLWTNQSYANWIRRPLLTKSWVAQ